MREANRLFIFRVAITAFLLLQFIHPASISAQQNTSSPQIYLRAATIAPVPNARPWLDSMYALPQTAPQQVLLHFNTLPTQEQKDLLQQNGVRLYDYLPDNTYIATFQSPPDPNSIGSVPLKSIIPVKAEWKADDYLWQKVNKVKNGNVEVLISFYSELDKPAIKSFIQQCGGVWEQGNMEEFGSYKVIMPAARLRSAASWYGVKYISPITTNSTLDLNAKGSSKVNLVALPPLYNGFNLLGDSMVIGVGDNTSGIYHIDMQDRITNFNPAAATNHGLHINGIIGSAGILNPFAEGTAFHAKLLDHYFDNILAYTGVMSKDYGMTITNNSYVTIEGDCSYEGTYDGYAQMVDQLCNQYKNILHVFAAGNDGRMTCAPYPAIYATVCGGYQASKNALCVANSGIGYSRAPDASAGPVKDGRLKPDISAVGTNVFSCIVNDGYEYASGSSMSSPATAGAAALLSQRFKQLNGGANPRADVLKTLLVNGAMDWGNPGPDYIYGFGFLDVYRSLGMLNNGYYKTNVVSNGGQKTMTIAVPANTDQLKVMLYWADSSGSPLASKTLVNDLDLTVTDPSAAVHLPLVLDPSPANVSNIAVEKADHLNNCEQVVINSPQAGNYTITVNGYSVPSLLQDYVVAYNFIPKGIQLTYPVAGNVIPANQFAGVYWEASSNDTNSLTLQYSTDNGNSWNLISNNIPYYQNAIGWTPPASVNSALCLLKLNKNNNTYQSTSGPFVISTQDTVYLDSVQCPGSMSVYWAPVPNTTSYQVLRKVGPYMQPIDTATTNHYIIHGLSLDSTYYVSVAPIVNGVAAGYRSGAISYQPNVGTCAGNYSYGDLMLEKIVAPNSGRKLTSIQLGTNEGLVLQLRNLYNSSCYVYSISYKINNGGWQSVSPLVPIPANGTITVTIPGINLSGAGNYKFTVAITNTLITDPVHQNDTLVKTISNFNNNPISLSSPFNDGFEGMGATTLDNNFIGLSSYWDYSTVTDSGRLRTFVDDSVLITGSRSVSMDDIECLSSGNQNYLIGTFNLATYNPANTELRTSFDYVLAGAPKSDSGNMVWVRGCDTCQWVNLYNYNLAAIPGLVTHSGTLSLSDAMLKGHQSFSTSTQVRFGQNDTSVIALRNFGNGLTLDNFSIYTVQNDVELVRIVAPLQTVCGVGNKDSLSVLLRNGVSQNQNNVLLFYQLDGGTIYRDTLATIGAKDSIVHTFKEPMNLSALGSHNLNVWISNAGDTYSGNDSILNYPIHNQPLISSFPYLENFESGNGFWYTNGINDSWQYGTPASQKIHKAASGTKAWKTNLAGNYNDLETSYLYSPCFDITGLANPMLSFSYAMEIENCGDVLCDAGYMEYSTDSITWTKLGATGQGTNWYDSTFDVWNEEGNTRWHVASIPLPHSSLPIRLRFVLASDPGATFEGMAVDDIHIFDLVYPVYDASSAYFVQPSASGNEWLSFTTPGGIFAQMEPDNSNLGNVNTTIYAHTNLANADNTQYVFPKSFTVKTSQIPTDSVSFRLYVTDSDFLVMMSDTTCISCSRPEDVYSLGITKYDNPNINLENGLLSDNIGGTYTYYPYSSVQWVPYDQGYYAQINVKSFSEFWLNDGGPTGNFSLVNDYLVFNARKISAANVDIDWTPYIDTIVNNYILQRSFDDSTFTKIDSVSALHQAGTKYVYVDTPSVSIGSSVYYRLQWLGTDDSVYYSPIRKVDWTNPDELVSIYPNPTNGLFTISWTASTGTDLKLSIVDAIGRTVLQSSITATEWNMSSTIQTPHLSTGIYFLRISIADKQYLQKILFY